jgi:hypothetical protein
VHQEKSDDKAEALSAAVEEKNDLDDQGQMAKNKRCQFLYCVSTSAFFKPN